MNSDDFGSGIFDVEPPDNHTCEWIESYYGYTCRTCGEMIPYGFEPWDDDVPLQDYQDEDESSEPIGTCEYCECDVFEADVFYDDDGSLLCGHCAWIAMGCAGAMNDMNQG